MPEESTIDQPVLIFQGGTDTLQLEPDGKVYRPGDRLPYLSHQRTAALLAAGVRIATVHPEPVITAEGRPAEMAAAEQIEGPAVVAAVEDMPKDAQPAPRASRKGSD